MINIKDYIFSKNLGVAVTLPDMVLPEGEDRQKALDLLLESVKVEPGTYSGTAEAFKDFCESYVKEVFSEAGLKVKISYEIIDQHGLPPQPIITATSAEDEKALPKAKELYFSKCSNLWPVFFK